MKNLSILILGVLAVLLIGCSGSDKYRGSWKATDSNGGKFQILFDAKSFTVTDSIGKSKNFDYTQNSVQIVNGVSTYGIKLGDGRGYQINFPKSSDQTVGLIKDENNNSMYTISRKDYIKYEDIFKLK